MESNCPPYQYIDILINRKEYNQLLHFYILCPENRWYLDREDKLELLSKQFETKFATFLEFREHYIKTMIEILDDSEAVEFTLEFLDPFVILLLTDKLKDTKLILRKFRAATLKEDYNRVGKLAKLLYAKRGFIEKSDIMFAKNTKKAEEVINEALGTSYDLRSEPRVKTEHGNISRIIFLFRSDNINNNFEGIRLLDSYSSYLGGTDENFKELVKTIKELLREKPRLKKDTLEALAKASLSPRMREEADKLRRYIQEKDIDEQTTSYSVSPQQGSPSFGFGGNPTAMPVASGSPRPFPTLSPRSSPPSSPRSSHSDSPSFGFGGNSTIMPFPTLSPRPSPPSSPRPSPTLGSWPHSFPSQSQLPPTGKYTPTFTQPLFGQHPDSLTIFNVILLGVFDVDNINEADLISAILAADGIAVSTPYDRDISQVVKLILSRITNFSFIWSLKSQQFRKAIEDYIANR